MWQVYALLAAVFAALTAIFSKLGVRDVDSGLATAIRVGFILLLTWGMSLYAGTWREVRQIGGHTWLFLFLSAVATGLSWRLPRAVRSYIPPSAFWEKVPGNRNTTRISRTNNRKTYPGRYSDPARPCTSPHA